MIKRVITQEEILEQLKGLKTDFEITEDSNTGMVTIKAGDFHVMGGPGCLDLFDKEIKKLVKKEYGN